MYFSLQELLKKEEKSVSILTYTAESAHNGLNMTCKAYNQKIHYDYVEDSVPIVVHCEHFLLIYHRARIATDMTEKFLPIRIFD